MKTWNNWLIVVPARLKSSRLPEKMLADLCGKPLIIRVFERLRPLKERGATILVATDNEKIEQVCRSHSVPVKLTDKNHQSGTDRCAEVAKNYKKEYVMNVQGDEPFVNVEELENLAHTMEQNSSQMGTIIYKNKNEKSFLSENTVKVVVNKAQEALYFSRAPIPFKRNHDFDWFWQHQGIYAFQTNTLFKFCDLPMSELEKYEKLEQLRAIEHKINIKLVESKHPSVGIDTADDLKEARKYYERLSQN